MKKIFIGVILVICSLGSNFIFGQTAQISEKQIQLLTYPFSDPNPVPMNWNIYPYYRIDGYSDKGVTQNWKMVEMENDYIQLWITPEIGGKIWGAIEKSTGKEFIYYNHVVKFRDIALRGPWTSGGIEMNFGIIGHAPTCSSPVDYFIRKNNDGSVSCFVGAIDLPSHTRWSVEINLPKDKAYFTTHSVWDNSTALEQSYYHWMNLGVKTAGNLEYVFPGKYQIGHNGKYYSWPIDEKGRRINFFNNNNFGNDKAYHIFGAATGFYGAYWHYDDFGSVHYAPYNDKPGRKIFLWSLSQEGTIWEKLLTDTDGQYTEIQSGRLFNQAEEGSSNTPFKNREFSPGLTDEWTEYWFPVKQTNGLKNALPAGSVNVQQQNDTVKIWFCPNEVANGNLEVRKNNEVIFKKEIHSEPLQVETEKFYYDGNYKSLSVWFDNKLLYETNQEKNLFKRPVAPPAEFNHETAYGHYLAGKEMERQRLYKTAEEEYLKSLHIEPYFVPALTGMANLAYRKTEYQISFKYSLKALSVDTYDADANMIYGLASLALKDTSSAIDGFSIATGSVLRRTAAFNALASVCLGKGDYLKAVNYAEKSLISNQLGTEAVQMKILSYRKLGKTEEFINALNELEKNDPLNHFIRFERFLSNPSSLNKTEAQTRITNELPHETYLEYALWYFRNGQKADATKILGLAPVNQPIVLIWTAYINHCEGNEQLAVALVNQAFQINPQFVFPSRPETLQPLEWAKKMTDDWKLSYYEGLIYLNAGEKEKTLDLWQSCGETPDFYPFYIARSKLNDASSKQAQADVERALVFAGNNWQAGLFASKFYFKRGDILKSEELARYYYGQKPQNYYLGLHFAKLLELEKHYPECISILQKIQVLPNEGATEGHVTWRNANIGKSLDLINAKKYRKALESINLARQWPINLGVGKPYQVDERLEDFIALQCYRKLNDSRSTNKMQERIIGVHEPADSRFISNDFITAWLLKETGNQPEGDEIMNRISETNPQNKSAQWCIAIYYGDKERAREIANEIAGSDPSILFLDRMFNEQIFN